MPALERALFGTDDPGEVAARIEGFCADVLVPPAEQIFYRAGVGVAAGLRLADGRQVVVKVHRWHAEPHRLAAVHDVQRALADRGLPVPRPLVGPTPLGEGVATVEEHLAGGERVDGHHPDTRAVLAEGLHDFLAAAAGLTADVRTSPAPEDSLWGEPHDVRFDFEATSAGAEWIDELAREARARLRAADAPEQIGHFDWRVENLALRDHAIVAIYDWDSLGLAPEPVIVGHTAADPPASSGCRRPDIALVGNGRRDELTQVQRRPGRVAIWRQLVTEGVTN